MADPAEEIVWLEQELAALRSQYALLERNGRVMKRAWQLMIPVLIIFFGFLIWKDAVMGGFAAAMAAAVAALVWYARPRNAKFRWIDVAMPTANEFDRGLSQAQKVEQWIAVRESRLAELRSASSPSGAATPS